MFGYPDHPLQSYVQLLSVHLFSMMDDGEELLDNLFRGGAETSASPQSLSENARRAAQWFRLLEVLDPGLEQQLSQADNSATYSVGFAEQLESSRPISDIVHLAAQSLMMLEDRYGVFGISDDGADVSDEEFEHIAPYIDRMTLDPLSSESDDEDGGNGPRLV